MNSVQITSKTNFTFAPFFILLTNASTTDLYCTTSFCIVGACWNPKEASRAVLEHIPALLWVPVANVTHYHKVELMSPTRIKRDFGITAAITAAILLAGGSATIASLIQTGATANTLNTAIEQSAAALKTQQLINAHFHTAIMNLQSQMDLSYKPYTIW